MSYNLKLLKTDNKLYIHIKENQGNIRNEVKILEYYACSEYFRDIRELVENILYSINKLYDTELFKYNERKIIIDYYIPDTEIKNMFLMYIKFYKEKTESKLYRMMANLIELQEHLSKK